MKRTKNIIYIFVLGSLMLSLTSCYCLRVRHTASAIDLETRPNTTSGTDLCCEGLEENRINTSVYYGVLTDQKLLSNVPSNFNETNGQFGLHANYLYQPFKKIPLKLGRIGLDYSFLATRNVYLGDAIQAYQQNRTEHRVMVNHDFATLISSHFIGYLNTQLGVNIRTNTNTLPSFSEKTNYLLDYRIGYNLNYFITKQLVIFIDAGYGGGNLIKTGISLWM